MLFLPPHVADLLINLRCLDRCSARAKLSVHPKMYATDYSSSQIETGYNLSIGKALLLAANLEAVRKHLRHV